MVLLCTYLVLERPVTLLEWFLKAIQLFGLVRCTSIKVLVYLQNALFMTMKQLVLVVQCTLIV
jgi:hypothetical protein